MPPTDHSTIIRLSRFGWFMLALVVLAPWAAVFLTLCPRLPIPGIEQKPPPAQTQENSSAKRPGEASLRSGPWGKLSIRDIMIEPPEAFIPLPDDNQRAPLWIFKGYTEAAIQDLWQTAGLTPAEKESFNDPARRNADATAIVIRPPPAVVINLSPAARGTIYSALASFPENPPQNEPFRFRSDSVDDWFVNSDLSADTIALTKRLLYRRAETYFFSDADIVLARLPTAAEQIRFLKAVSRKSALLVQLRVGPGSDAMALARYWGRGRRSKDLEPLLFSLVRQPEENSLDIVHLLPRFARALLYTYPLPTDSPADAARDCHWTSFNFYNEQPDERFTDIDFVKRALAESYYPVAGESILGDIILLVQPGGTVIHSCVYIADNIVFTKNGPAYSVPWVLSPLDYVVAFYSRGQKLELRRYRPKGI